MTPVVFAGIAAPLLPVALSFIGRRSAWAGCGLGAALLILCGAVAPDGRSFLASLVPLWASLSFAAFHLADERAAAFHPGRAPEALVEETRRRHEDLKVAIARAEGEARRSLQIYGMAKALAESVSWKDMAPRLAAGIQKVFGAYEFLLYGAESGGEWMLLQRRGTWANEPPAADIKVAESSLLFPPVVREIVPVLAVPVPVTEGGVRRLSGVLFMKPPEASKAGSELIETGREFGEQLGVALAKALLFNRMELHSRTDGLTGALRRQPFMDRLEEELKRASVFQTPFSIMMIDIDHFKAVNDGHGHAAGDAVLARVGDLLRESFYETDVVGRYGGEEFIVLLPRSEEDGVMRKAESLRRRIESEAIACGFETLKVTISIGLSHFPEGGRTAERLIERADRALYAAKEGGRNRVVAA